jgi:hypothetical protein
MPEINENYALNLCEYPSLTRCSEPEIETLTEVGRVFAIGASHMKRIVGGLVSKNLEVINLSRSGWKADKDTIPESSRKLKEYNLKSSDTVIIDPVSNSVFCGTDDSGNPVNPEKDESRTWHIVGELAFRPKTVLKNTHGFNRYFRVRNEAANYCSDTGTTVRTWKMLRLNRTCAKLLGSGIRDGPRIESGARRGLAYRMGTKYYR